MNLRSYKVYMNKTGNIFLIQESLSFLVSAVLFVSDTNVQRFKKKCFSINIQNIPHSILLLLITL